MIVSNIIWSVRAPLQILLPKKVPAGCSDCFDEPPGVGGWDLGKPGLYMSEFDSVSSLE